MSIPFARSGSVQSLAQPQSQAAEAYRRLRTMVDLAVGERPGVRLVTSPNAGSGTTTMVANLGVALASVERPVLLLDGNLYRPRLHSLFGLSNDLGLTSVLTGEAAFADVAQAVPAYPGVHVVTAGPPVTDPAALLSAPTGKRAMAAAAAFAPVVFVDGPPLLPVTGGVVLAGLSAGVLVVVRAGRTSQLDLDAAVELVEQTGTRLLGVVLNAVRSERTRRLRYRDRDYVRKGEAPSAPTQTPRTTPTELKVDRLQVTEADPVVVSAAAARTAP